MTKYYSIVDLSNNISETPEGYLICRDAAIARAGDLLYSQEESGVSSEDGISVVTRTAEDICNPKTIASFEGKPITYGHPLGDQFVTPENWKDFAVGIIQNVRRGEGIDEDKLLADLLITDVQAIYAVKKKELRELSCGYEADFVDLENGTGRQINIVGNHVALVKNGRCGSQCSIFDRLPKDLEGKKKMIFKDRILNAVKKVCDEDMLEEGKVYDEDSDLTKIVTNLASRLDKIEARMSATDEDMTTEERERDDEDAKRDDKKEEAKGALEKKRDDEDAKRDDKFERVEAALEKLISLVSPSKSTDEDVDVDIDEDSNSKQYSDNDTLCRAEILCPGISDSKDIKARALKSAFKTKDGKEVIEKVLSGKTFDSADKDLLFVAASELLKNKRDEKMNVFSTTAYDVKKDGVMTPEKLNALNEKRYSVKN